MDRFTLNLELNGTNIIDETERHGRPRDLFWPWCAANVSFLALSYGAFFLGYGISFWQATAAAFIGTVSSFLLVGLSSLAGKRSNAPTMILSRAMFGVKGNIVPGLLSYVVFVGWETVLVSLATLATGTVFKEVGHVGHNTALIAGFIVAAALTALGGILGLEVIMRLQRWLTIITLAMTTGFIALTVEQIHWDNVASLPSGSLQQFIGAAIFAVTGIGLGWVNCAADYSRYLPRTASSRGVIGWTVFGSSVVPIILVSFGALLAASSDTLNSSIAQDPIGALAETLPTWYLVPFAIVAVLGLVGGAVLDLYSSGLALISIGLPVKRHIAACIDAVIMLIGTIYIAWFANDFSGPFQGFLITLGVPLAVWSAMFVADVLMRRRDFVQAELYTTGGRYRDWNLTSLGILAFGSIIGWGFVSNTFASWLSWQGYFLNLIGGKSGPWAYSNVGVIVALMIGFFGHIALGRRTIRQQEQTT